MNEFFEERQTQNRASLESNATTGHMAVAILGADELTPLMDSIPDSRPALKRLVEFLSTNPHAPTAAVNNAIAVSNISQEANAANRKLYFLGFMVGCMRPPVQFKNTFKQDPAQHLWSIYKLPKEESNDSEGVIEQ